jgi:short-subunit dehydrogenase
MAGLTSPPFMGIYNVTKHSVVTLSETLFADLQMAGADGVGVSVLCPGWVNTRIHEADRNRPAGNGDGDAEPAPSPRFSDFVGSLLAGGLDPAAVASQVVDAVRTRRFYVLTHPEWKPMITGRTDRIVAGEDPNIATLPL